MNVSVFLRGAKAHIDTPAKWCQKAMCTDLYNQPVIFNDSSACKFCAIGAVILHRNKLAGTFHYPLEKKWVELYTEAKELLLDFSNGMCITEFNDSHSHAEIMKMFNDAIRQAELNEAGIF